MRKRSRWGALALTLHGWRFGMTLKLALAFFALSAALIGVLSALAYTVGIDALRAAGVANLNTAVIEKEAALASWIEEKRLDIVTVASSPSLSELVQAFVASPEGAAAARLADRILAELRLSVEVDPEYTMLSVLEPDAGEIVLSTAPGEVGKFKEDRAYFLRGREGTFVEEPHYALPYQSAVMPISTPLRAADGRVLAVLTGWINLDGLQTIVRRHEAGFRSYDAYLVNRANLALTQPRFMAPQAAFRRFVHTEAVDRCLTGRDGWVGAPDYRGVPVLSVYRWLEDWNACLLSEIDQDEAFASAQVFGRSMIVTAALALVVATGIGAWLARGINRPLRELQRAAETLGRGEMWVRLDERRRDELGTLAQAFNWMASRLAQERVQLRDRAERFFNLSNDLLCIADFDGRFRELNPAWERVLGYPQDELKSKPLMELVHPDDRAATQEALAELSGDENVLAFENRCRCRDGSYRWLMWNAVPATDEGLVYAVARDVTERKHIERELERYNRELERSNAELEQFAYVASHDLQEPLRKVANYTELLVKRYRERLDDKADHFMDYIVDGSVRMQQLINDLLAYSRVGRTDTSWRAVDLNEVMGGVRSALEHSIERSGAEVSCDPLPTVQGRRSELAQLLQNLLSNALKFRGDAPPRVRVSAERSDDTWAICVADNGIGIEPEYLDKIFVIFRRLHTREEYDGTGIGLALCKKIVEGHGGRIWAESELGQGTCVCFTLPEGGGEHGRDASTL